MFIGTLLLGLTFYLINYWWNKKRGVNLHEHPNLTNVDQNISDVIRNWNWYKDKDEFKKFGRHVQLLQEKEQKLLKTKNMQERALLAGQMEYIAVEISTRFKLELDDH